MLAAPQWEQRMHPRSRPRRQMSTNGPSGSIKAILAHSILVPLIILPLLAFASPPDPSWAEGLYDNADADDIVALIYETAGIEPASIRHMPPLPHLFAILLISRPSTIHGFRTGQFTRGPPLRPPLPSKRPPARLVVEARAHISRAAATIVSFGDPQAALDLNSASRRFELSDVDIDASSAPNVSMFTGSF